MSNVLDGKHKMKAFKFELQSNISVIVTAKNMDEARKQLQFYIQDGFYDEILMKQTIVNKEKEIKVKK